MTKRVTLTFDDDAADLLPRLAPSLKKQGEFVSELIKAAAATRGAPAGTELEAFRLQLLGLTSEVQAVKARLVALESRHI